MFRIYVLTGEVPLSDHSLRAYEVRAGDSGIVLSMRSTTRLNTERRKSVDVSSSSLYEMVKNAFQTPIPISRNCIGQ